MVIVVAVGASAVMSVRVSAVVPNAVAAVVSVGSLVVVLVVELAGPRGASPFLVYAFET